MIAQILSAVIGIWLMGSPVILKYNGIAADNSYIIGPLITSFAVISWWEATRQVRLANSFLAAWLIISPFVLSYSGSTEMINNFAVGSLILALSLIKGKIEESFGGGWKSLF